MRIVLTGGGTGGHLLPFGPLIEALRAREEVEITFFGIVNESTRAFFAQYGVVARHVPSGKLRRYVSHLTLFDLLLRLPLGIGGALVRMYFTMPEAVVSLGGYGSVPTLLAAAFYRIPILLHESDAVVGLANKHMARLAAAISLGFSQAREDLGKYGYKAVVTGTPVREDIHRLDRSEARRTLGIAETEHVLLVTGGSQGARQLNEILLQILPKLVLEATVIHITGQEQFKAVRQVSEELLAQSSRKKAYRPYAYLTEEMLQALVAADSIVARAGASTLCEIAALRKPALLIPLPGAAQDHQRKNAQAFEGAGAALVLDPSNLTKNLFENNVRRLLHEEETRQHLRKNLATLDHPDAATKMAELVFQLVQGLAPVR